jgi:hypothetical protein
MGLIIIPNQPVSFEDTTDSCKCTTTLKYNQLVNFGDVTQFQVKLEACNDAEQLIPDSGFDGEPNVSWILPSDYTIAFSQLCRGDTTGTSCAEADLSVISTPGVYQVTLVVASGSAYFNLQGTDFSYTSEEVGEGINVFTFFFYDDDATLSVCLSPNSCISSIEMKRIYAPRVSVFAEDGTWIHTFNGEDINQNTISNPEGEFTFAEDTMTFSLNWDSLEVSEGCYNICLIDPCDTTNGQNLENLVSCPNFSEECFDAEWFADGTNFSISFITQGLLYQSANDDGFLSLQSNNTPLVEGICYDASFTIMQGETYPYYAEARLVTESFAGTWQSAWGTYTESFTAQAGEHIFIEVRSLVNPGPDTEHNMAISNITCNVADECLECAYDSNMFKLGSHECTHLINVCNNDNGMGFVFNNSGFSPRIRLYSKYVKATYKAERDSFENSYGRKSVQYFKRRKARLLKVDTAPEYVHDFLSTLMGYDHLWIASVEYFVIDEEYNPIYNELDDEFASVEINIEEKIQLVQNVNCGDNGNICVLTAQGYLADPLDPEYVLGDPQGRCLNAPINIE